MRKLHDAVVNGLGFDAREFKNTIEDADLCKDNEFFNFYHKELLSELSEIKEMLKDIVSGNMQQQGIYKQAESRIPNWYEWVELKKKLDRLDTDKNQYILIVDKLSEPGNEYLRILANVNWKLVIDLDPDSDNGGLLTQFKSIGAIVSTLLPSQLKGVNPDNLPQPNATQWLHANGRSIELTEDQKFNMAEISKSNLDGPKDTTDEWDMSFRIPCQELIRIMCEKFDRMKQQFCLILGIRGGLSSEITNLISKDIRRRFKFINYEMNFISIASEIDLSNFPNSTCSGLLTFQFLIGLAGLTGKSLETEYFVPSGVKGCPVPLDSKHYSALSEYMEILYDGCEDIPEGLDDEEELDSFKKQHLKSFISGNIITFQSLHFHHDARRDLTNEIYDYILSLSKEAQKAYIIEIKHAPGSGGTTLARRVIWDLHKRLPCVIVKMDYALQNFGQDSYGETYVENLCKRISKLQEICQVAPVILMDGNSAQVNTLSSCVARKLRKTPMVILRCVKHKPSAGTQEESIDKMVEREFELDYILDSKSSDFAELEKAFDSYYTQFPEDSKASKKLRLRVFHFPMLALLGKFTKLQSIVSNSLDFLKTHNQKEYEIAIVVAFIQIFANENTPASLISIYILKSNNTHETLGNQFSETLMNLMVPGKPQGGKQHIADKYFKGSDDEDEEEEAQHQFFRENYTFQHHQVANAILEYSKRSFHEITKDFLDYRILECYRINKEITYIIDQLFLYHEAKNETHFSKLISTLAKLCEKKMGKNADETQFDVGTTFEDAAKQTKDATFYSHVARFFSYNKDYTKAIELIKEGLNVEENVPRDRKRRILDTFGHIALNEMKNKEIEDKQHLQIYAKEALNLFKQAKDIPPRNFPNPIIGIVRVWQFCFGYLIKKFSVEKVIELTVKDEFFSNSIAECFDLLNEVDDMVKELALLPDPVRTKTHADRERYSLVQKFGKTKSKTKRQGLEEVDFLRICESYKATAPQKYVIRLQAMWLISEVKRDFVRLSKTQKEQLYSWLKKLVNDFDMLTLTRDLLCVAAVQEKPPFHIDEALTIIERWQDKYPNDYFSYFYQYMLCFIKISEGKISDYKAKYESGIVDCDKWTKENMRRNHHQFFLGKSGKSSEICNLVPISQLRLWHKEKCKLKQDEEKEEDVLDQTFWKRHCRDYLLECKGRIHLSGGAGGRNPQPYINLEPGNIRISVYQQDVGTLGIDYHKDTKVSFVVAFTLAGPKAKAIECPDRKSKKSGQEVRSGRQGSRMTHQKK